MVLTEEKKQKSLVVGVQEAVQELRQGRLIIVTDSEERENEGDLIVPAEDATPEIVNFMATHGRGLVCVPISSERAQALELAPMVKNNQDVHRTAFTVSVDARQNTSTGISAYDRSRTIQLLANPASRESDFVKPGHIFPLVGKEGGVLVRAGHTEASLDLMALAGKKPAAVICEIMKEDGTMARMPDLAIFAEKYDLKIVTIKDLIQHRYASEIMVKEVARSRLPTKYGDFESIAFESKLDGKNHIALVMGEIKPETPTLLRVHSECLTGDVFHSLRCDCGFQLDAALERISAEGKGILLYMRQEGRGIGLVNKLKAYKYQEEGFDTVEANQKLGLAPDLRDYGMGAQIIGLLGVKKMRLMTNNPRKVIGLEGYSLELVERVPLVTESNAYNKKYLSTKASKLGHFLNE